MGRRDRRNRPGDLSSRGAQHRQLERTYIKYEGVCQICFKFCPREEASRDHVKELCLGGTSDDSNIVLAHQKCNNKRSTHLANSQPKLGCKAEDLPLQWWASRNKSSISGAIFRQANEYSVTGKIPPRLIKDEDFFSALN